MKNKPLGFTLVELIIVITILAILGTIGFFSYIGYMEDSRDLVRLTDINNIKKGLGIFITQSGKYPEPTNGESVSFTGVKVWTQGTFGESTFKNIRVLSKIPLDPYSENEYTYSVTNSKLEYEISGILEKDSYLGLNLSNLEANASGKKIVKAYVGGTYNGIVTRIKKGGIDYVIALPSITSKSLSGTDLDTILANNNLVVNSFGNLPSSYTSSLYNRNYSFIFNPSNIIVYNGYISELTETNNQIILLNSIQKAYSGSSLLNQKGIVQDLLKLKVDLVKPSEQAKVFACNFINYTLKYYVPCIGIDFITFFVTNILHFDITNLPGSQINIAYQDISNGDFWFGTNDGIAKYSNGEWTIYQKDPNNPNSLVNNNVTSITRDNTGNYWFGTVNGLSMFDGGSVWTTYSNNVLVSSHIQYVYTAADGTVWVGTNGGVSAYNSVEWNDYMKKSMLSANNITTIYEDSNGDLWFGTNSKGVDKYQVINGEGVVTNYSTPKLPNKIVTYIFQDSTNNLWIGTEGGLAMSPDLGSSWTQYTSSMGNLPGDNITYIYQDNSNNYWFGTKNNGVVKATSDLSVWTTYDTSNSPIQLSGNEVKSIFKDDTGNILVITNGGVNTIDTSGNIIN